MAKVVTEKLTLKFKRRKMKDREIERVGVVWML